MKVPAGLQKLRTLQSRPLKSLRDRDIEKWTAAAVTSAWTIQCCGIFLAFCGIAGASGDAAARGSIAYMWFSILLQAAASVAFLYMRWRRDDAVATVGVHVALTATISSMCLIITCDRAVQLSIASVRCFHCKHTMC